MDQLDPRKDNVGGLLRLESEHRSDAAFNPSMILLNPVIEIFARADDDRFRLILAVPILQSAGRIAGEDCFPICLASVDDNTIRSTMTVERLVEKPLGRGQVPVLAEEEFDRIANAVDGSVEVHPFASNFDVCLVHMPFAGHGSFALVEPFKQLRGKA